MSAALIQAALELSDRAGALSFGGEVAALYNPLTYAWEPHRRYLEAYGGGTKKVLFLGMNPGPWGMAQTGIPFGEIPAARDWLKVEAPVSRPGKEHPKRPVQGFGCPKSEVSGRRFWGLMRERFITPEAFFQNHFVLNYCPLVFMGESGKNLTPDKLPKAESEPLYQACDEHLRRVIEILQPEILIGVGKFALERFEAAAPEVTREWIIHPSPANPHANRGWSEAVVKKLVSLGVWEG
jgi:single-strand selective monofunctional uracil DNA glycosylase